MLQHIYDTLELRVGTRLANQMTDQQLQEFEQFIDAGGENNQAQALQWLETNLPNYKQVVNDVFEELKGEVKQMAPQILAATPAPTTQGVVDQPQVPAQDFTASQSPRPVAAPDHTSQQTPQPSYGAQPQPMSPQTPHQPYSQQPQPGYSNHQDQPPA